MKNSTRIYIMASMVLALVIVLIIVGMIILNQGSASTSSESVELLYELEYYNDNIPGDKYDIAIYNNRNIEIVKTSFCSAKDCEPTEQKNSFQYSKENMQSLETFIKDHVPGTSEGKATIHQGDLNDYEEEVMSSLCIGEKYFEIAVEKYAIKFIYSPSEGTEYLIYFKEDDSIIVKKVISADYEITSVDTYSIQFSKENMERLAQFRDQYMQSQEKVIYRSTLYANEEKYIESIIHNDEKYLVDVENIPSILYMIHYQGINCPTPTLRLYSDGTYEYFYTYSYLDEPIQPKTGTYQYDVSKIIQNIEKYPEDALGPYTITTPGKTYVTYSSNVELQELLSSIGVNLQTCIVAQS